MILDMCLALVVFACYPKFLEGVYRRDPSNHNGGIEGARTVLHDACFGASAAFDRHSRRRNRDCVDALDIRSGRASTTQSNCSLAIPTARRRFQPAPA